MAKSYKEILDAYENLNCSLLDVDVATAVHYLLKIDGDNPIYERTCQFVEGVVNHAEDAVTEDVCEAINKYISKINPQTIEELVSNMWNVNRIVEVLDKKGE
jgi:hypothetical protein